MSSGAPRGLPNLGNSCYVNSVLQALASLRSVWFLLNDPTLLNGHPVTAELRKALAWLQHSDAGRAFDPAALVRMVRRQLSGSAFDQEDAQVPCFHAAAQGELVHLLWLRRLSSFPLRRRHCTHCSTLRQTSLA